MHILYATDGSEASLAGAHLLAKLPLEAETRVTILTVVPEHGDGDADATLAAARDALRHTVAAIDTDVRRGDAADEILNAAGAHTSRPAADLIVVGSRGLSGIARFFLGSVAERVARYAPCPTLLARPLAHGLQRAVVAVDGSESSDRAARWLQEFPLPDGSEVHLVRVLPPKQAALLAGDMAWPVSADEFDQLYEQEQRRAQERLDTLVAAFARAGKPATASLKMGDPAHTILQSAEERSADLIAVGSKGLSGIDRFLLGSVSEKVLHYADCSVLVVR